MSSTLTKNIVLSQHKVGSNTEVATVPNLAYEAIREDEYTILKVEIPGVDPSTVSVSCEGAMLRVECTKGVLSHSVDLLTDVSGIRADIQWGLLTLRIPNPPAPLTHSIKVSVHDAVKSAPSTKVKAKAEEEVTEKG